MRSTARSIAVLSKVAFAAALVGAAMCMAPISTQADVLFVNCTGADPTAFPSITAALNSLPVNSSTEPHTINVTGPCTENVSLVNRELITIQGPAGGTASIVAANPAATVLQISRSRNIDLRRLVISGGAIGLGVAQSSATVQGCTIENNTGPGISMANNSTVQLGGPQSSQAVQVINNGLTTGRNAIGVNFSFLSIGGNTTVDNNGNAPLNVLGGTLSVDGTVGENFFRNNGFGVNIAQGSAAQFTGQNTIQNNGVVGVQVFQSSTAVFTSATLAGIPRVTTIEGHEITGVNIVSLGEITFNGPHRIRNNGLGSIEARQSGIRVSRASLSMQNGTEISGNFGPGILLDTNSSLSAIDSMISNNSAEGVRVIRQSVAGLTSGNLLSGNGSNGLTCDTTSLVFGDLTGIDNINCSRIERESGPPRRGRILEP